MGMSTYVHGYGPPDERWRKMAAVWHACAEAGIDPPAEVEEYFEDGPPDRRGQEIHVPSTHWSPDDKGWPAEGIEVKVSDIPEGVEYIRFINSY